MEETNNKIFLLYVAPESVVEEKITKATVKNGAVNKMKWKDEAVIRRNPQNNRIVRSPILHALSTRLLVVENGRPELQVSDEKPKG